MNILILGAAGFIGTNLTFELAKNSNNNIIAADKSESYFIDKYKNYSNVLIKEVSFEQTRDIENLIKDIDIVYHLFSSINPSTSNKQVYEDMKTNVMFSIKILDLCVKNNVKKVIFLSSGGTVYGKEISCPIVEDAMTRPISSYGIQKITIENILYLYNYMHGLDYRIIRLSNPYGPYQRPNGTLGVVTTFTYKILKKEAVNVYGDGSVVRDFIYIDDAVKGIINIANEHCLYKVYNLGCGYGTSVKEVIRTISETLHMRASINYLPGRNVDVPENYLDISRYEKEFGGINAIPLPEGIKKTAEFMKNTYF